MGITPNVTVAAQGATARLHAALSAAVGTDQWTLVDWQGAAVSGAGAPRFTLILKDRSALGALLSPAPERGFGRAYANGDIEIDPLRPFLEVAQRADRRRLALSLPRVVLTALAAGVRPATASPTTAEARLSGRRHSAERDAAAIRHHYDLPVEFYQLWLDTTMTYSCAYFETAETDLDSAQAAKLDLVCRKLRLRAGERLLDIGSGWGSLALHAACRYGVRATGITISPTQAEYSAKRARELGIDNLVDFQLRDYRRVEEGAYDAIASIGMVEHVGRANMPRFATLVHRALKPGGRALIHGITDRPEGRPMRGSFLDAFVFPDGDLQDIGFVIRTLERAGLEVRDVESLREHYALTLEHWVRRLESAFERAAAIAGADRARVWRLYMTGSAIAFTRAQVGIHQTLAVKIAENGESRLPLTRQDWYRMGSGLTSERR